jgi:regulator of protease activity HflC (stomatin/prohibitin superfamily)
MSKEDVPLAPTAIPVATVAAAPPPDLTMLDAHPQQGFNIMSDVMIPFCSLLCCPAVVCCSWTEVKEKEEVVVLEWGRYKTTVKDPGLQFINCIGSTQFKVSTALQSMDLPNSRMVDGLANPLFVSAVVNYKVRNPYRAFVDTVNYNGFMRMQASTTLKEIVAKYPYEAPGGNRNIPSLQHDPNGVIIAELITTLQKNVASAGIEIKNFELNEMSYAPEIAAGMLKKQQAHALVAARATIVEGAVGTAYSAIKEMENRGLNLSEQGKERLIISLLTVMVSDAGAQPTVKL